MRGIRITQKGSFKHMEDFLERSRRIDQLTKLILEKYGEIGLIELKNATPVRTGLTASSWYYEVKSTKKGYEIHWCNRNIQNGINVALIVALGHGTATGGYVPPNDYITPALREVFEKIADDMWKEVTSIE